MNKKAGTKTLLKTLIGFLIAIFFIILLLAIPGKFILFGREKADTQENFFNELNNKIQKLGINEEETQAFQLESNRLLIAFNKKDTEISRNVEVYLGNKKDVNTIFKKPPECTNCLCLCKTEDDKLTFENDCLQENDICENYEKEIKNNDKEFFLFGEGLYNLKIKKGFDDIIIEY